jgi:hypothetical protein
MKNLINILIFVIGFNNVNAQSTELKEYLSKKVDTISFKSNGFNNYREIILLDNQEFIRKEFNATDYGGGKSTIIKYYGKYTLTDSILTLNPKKIELETFTGKNTERKELKEKFDYKSDSELKITTVFTLKKYNDIQYLLPYSLTDLQFEKLSRTIIKRLFKRPLNTTDSTKPTID